MSEINPHISCLKIGQNIEDVYELIPCDNDRCGFKCKGKKIHCPLCLTDIFKPNRLKKVLSHLEKTHFSEGKGCCETRGFLISKCHLNCRDHGHFHCPICNKTIIRKDQLMKHAFACVSGVQNTIADDDSINNDGSNDGSRDGDIGGSHQNTIAGDVSINNDGSNNGSQSNLGGLDGTHQSGQVHDDEARSEESHTPLEDNTVESRTYQECSYCKKYFAKKSLNIHIRKQHLKKTDDGEILPKSHYSVCVDTNKGIYAVSIRLEGPQTPLHVLFKSFGPDQRMECSRNACMDIWATEVRSGKTHYMCQHVESVQHTTVTAPHHELSLDKLHEMADSRFLTISRRNELMLMFQNAEKENSPMIAIIPNRETYSDRYKWYSVFSNTVMQHFWCKYNRVIVTLDNHLKCIKCKCKIPSCIHASVLKWYLFEIGENFRFATTNSDEESVDNDMSLPNTSHESIKKMVEYIHDVKSIKNDDILKIKFDPDNIPHVLEPTETQCFFCQSQLVESKPFLRPVIYCNDREPISTGFVVRFRTCVKCSAVYRYQEWDHGIFNYDNKIFISLPLLLDIRYGLSTHTAISRTCDAILSRKLKLKLNEQTIQIIRNAYLAFEAMVKHEYKFSCLHCGHHPKILVFDCCRKISFDFSLDDIDKTEPTGPTVNADIFWDTVEKKIIARTMVNNEKLNPFKIPFSYSEWAPYIGASTRKNNMLYNTEYKKFKESGDNNLLCKPVPEELLKDMAIHCTTKKVKELCENLNVSTTGGKFDMLQRLREISLSRAEFDKYYSRIMNKSGGWLTASCHHNIIYAAKFLFRSESPSDYLDIIKSFKYQPTVSIIDVAHRVASLGNKLYPGMFEKNNGRLLPVTEKYMVAAERNELTISIPALQDNVPISKPSANQHPITGLDYSFCLFDQFHQDNSKLRPELLRKASIVKELAGYMNTPSAEQIYSKFKKDLYFLNMFNPIAHMFSFRLMCQFKNSDINDTHTEKLRKSLNNFEPTLNFLGQIVRDGCVPISVQGKDSTVSVHMREKNHKQPEFTVSTRNEIKDTRSHFLTYNNTKMIRQRVIRDANSMFRSACIAHNNYSEENYETLRKNAYEWCLQNQAICGCNDTQVEDLGLMDRFVVNRTLKSIANVMCCVIYCIFHDDTNTIECEIFEPMVHISPGIFLYLETEVDHYDVLIPIETHSTTNRSEVVDSAERACVDTLDLWSDPVDDSTPTTCDGPPPITIEMSSSGHRRPPSPPADAPVKKRTKPTTQSQNGQTTMTVSHKHTTRSKTGHKIGPKKRYSPPPIGRQKNSGIYRKKVHEAPQWPCAICLKSCSSGNVIGCSYCDSWEHFACRNLTGTETFLKNRRSKWKCSKCTS